MPFQWDNRIAGREHTMGKLHLSPSDYHAHLMAETVPSLAYDGGDVAAWQRRLRRKLRQLLGDMPKERVALRPETIWSRQHELGRIEKIVFTAEPFADVTAYLCIPDGLQPPYPFVICLQGHSTGAHVSIAVQRDDETQPFEVEGDRDFGLGCMRRGMAALCIEQRSFGERREQRQVQVGAHGCHDATMQALMLGKTLLGERIYDVDRGIDYLASRGDVDMNCVGVMGNSGGGTVSLFAAAMLPRLAFAMPSSYFCTFRDSIMSIYHCMDNYVPGLYQVAEMADVMGLFAPKPVVIVSGKTDPIFPIAPARKAFRDLKRIYEACGAANRCHMVIGNEGHRFYAQDAWPVLSREIRRIRQHGKRSAGIA